MYHKNMICVWKEGRTSLNVFIKEVISISWLLYLNTSFEINKSIRASIKSSFLLRKYKNFFKVLVSWSIRNFPEMDFVYFSSLGWKVQGFIWENIRNVSFWENIRTETSFWGNIRIFLILDDLECSISGNIKGIFFAWKCFGFFGLGCEVN